MRNRDYEESAGNSPRPYRCVISPGIAEVRSNVNHIRGFLPIEFEKFAESYAPLSSDVCVDFTVRDFPLRQISENTIEIHGMYGEGLKGVLQREYHLLGPKKARIQLSGLTDRPALAINGTYQRWGKTGFGHFHPPGMHLRDVLFAEIARARYQPLHGVAFASSGDGALVVGPPGAGKTAVLFHAVRNGFEYLADDLTIADSDGYIYACPGLSSFAYELAELQEFGCRRNAGFWKARALDVIARRVPIVGPLISSLLFERPHIDVNFFAPQVKFVDKAKTQRIFILIKGSRHLKKLSHQEALRMLVSMNDLEFSYKSNPLLIGYSLMNPEFDLSEIARIEGELLQSLVEKSTCYLCMAWSSDEHFDLIKSCV